MAFSFWQRLKPKQVASVELEHILNPAVLAEEGEGRAGIVSCRTAWSLMLDALHYSVSDLYFQNHVRPVTGLPLLFPSKRLARCFPRTTPNVLSPTIILCRDLVNNRSESFPQFSKVTLI